MLLFLSLLLLLMIAVVVARQVGESLRERFDVVVVDPPFIQVSPSV